MKLYLNGENLNFYNQHPKLKYEMQYMYEHFISQDEYQKFWDDYSERYFDLKSRFREAYGVEEDF